MMSLLKQAARWFRAARPFAAPVSAAVRPATAHADREPRLTHSPEAARAATQALPMPSARPLQARRFGSALPGTALALAAALSLSACGRSEPSPDPSASRGPSQERQEGARDGRDARERGERGDRGGRKRLSEDEALALYAPAHRQPGLSACTGHFPAGQPVDLTAIASQWQAVGLCSEHFAVVHSGLSKTPLLVVEKLDQASLQDASDETRTDQFYADPRLPRSQRAELGDYKGSGFDRGHMAPAANQPTATAMGQSFALSNMVPQDRVNNQKIWAKIESDVRKYVRRAKGPVYVFSGPLFDDSQQRIGRQQVWVPTRLFKLVYDATDGRAWAYLLDNRADTRVQAPLPYEDFVRETGWKVLGHVPVTGSISAGRLTELDRSERGPRR